MLTAELPKIVHSLSLTRVGVEQEMKINNTWVVTHPLSKNYKQLIGYYNHYNATVDIKIIESKETTTRCWLLVNTEDYLGIPVTNKQLERYNSSLEGETTVTFEKREAFIEDVESLCMVTETLTDEKTLKYHGSCFSIIITVLTVTMQLYSSTKSYLTWWENQFLIAEKATLHIGREWLGIPLDVNWGRNTVLLEIRS